MATLNDDSTLKDMYYFSAIICLILGFIMLIFPETAWILDQRFKDPEANNLELIFGRILGIIFITIAAAAFFVKIV